MRIGENLADKTARATEQITARMAAIQEPSSETVHSIQEIDRVIAKVRVRGPRRYGPPPANLATAPSCSASRSTAS